MKFINTIKTKIKINNGSDKIIILPIIETFKNSEFNSEKTIQSIPNKKTNIFCNEYFGFLSFKKINTQVSNARAII